MRPLFFIHIPKTGGTSFRLAAQQYFTQDRIICDYGKTSDTTSRLVLDRMYAGQADLWELGQDCERLNIAMISGHVPIGRYVPLAGVCNTVAFVRRPLQRIASEYAHFVRHRQYTRSFKDFYSTPIMQNRQSRLLNGVPLEAVGLVGPTEKYPECIGLFNEHFHSGIAYRKDNIALTDVGSRHEIGPEGEAALERLNGSDIALYGHANQLFEARLSLHRKGLPYVHACLVNVETKRVAGWAWWADGRDAPVVVEVWVNGSIAGTGAAVEFRRRLCGLHTPRGGCVGFHLPIALAPGDEVQCRVADTGQRFPAGPVRVPDAGG